MVGACKGCNPSVLGHGNNGLEEAPTICLVPLDDEGRSIYLGVPRTANSNSRKPNGTIYGIYLTGREIHKLVEWLS